VLRRRRPPGWVWGGGLVDAAFGVWRRRCWRSRRPLVSPLRPLDLDHPPIHETSARRWRASPSLVFGPLPSGCAGDPESLAALQAASTTRRLSTAKEQEEAARAGDEQPRGATGYSLPRLVPFKGVFLEGSSRSPLHRRPRFGSRGGATASRPGLGPGRASWAPSFLVVAVVVALGSPTRRSAPLPEGRGSSSPSGPVLLTTFWHVFLGHRGAAGASWPARNAALRSTARLLFAPRSCLVPP